MQYSKADAVPQGMLHEQDVQQKMQVEFLTTLDLRIAGLDGDRLMWLVLAPFVAVVDGHLPTQRIIRVESGFLTDLLSIPRMPLVYLRFANRAQMPAVIHDHLYSQGGTEADRAYADQVFYQGMLDTGIEANDALTMFRGVREFGKKHFRYDTPAPTLPPAPLPVDRA